MPKRRCALALTLIEVIFATVPTLGQTQEKKADAKPDYAKEAFIVELYSQKVKFENDGTSAQELTVRTRVQSDAGVEQYGLLTFSYPSGTATFEIVYVRVHKADGSVVETPADSIQDTASEITRQAPFYSDLREKHVPVKGLSAGDEVEYKTVEHVNRPLVPGQFWVDYTFARDIIVLQEQLEVSIPRERAIKLKSPYIQPVINEVGGYRVYSWSGSNPVVKIRNEKLEAAKAVWEQGRGRFPGPDVALTSFASWDEVGHWYGELQKERVKITPEIQAKAAELTKGAADDEAKLRALYNYVSTEFRYIGIAFGVGRYQPHFASEVLANQYGDCKDKHTLLASLLSAAGFKTYPALISTQLETDADIPSVTAFNHVITVVPRGDHLIWLDTTTGVGPFQYLLPQLRGKRALVVFDDKAATLMSTPVELPYPATQTFEMTATLDDQGTLAGRAEFVSRGDQELLLRSAFRQTAMAQWKDLGQRISLNLGFGGEVSEVTASAPEKTNEAFRISYKYIRKEYGDWPNRRVMAPSPAIGLPEMSPEIETIPVPFWLGAPVEISFHSQLELPKGYKPEIPAAIHEKRSFGQYDSDYVFNDGKLISDRHLRIATSELQKPDFSQYENFRKTIVNDYGSFIQVTSAKFGDEGEAIAINNSLMNSMRALPDSPNAEASQLEQQAREAFQANEFQSAVSSLYRAVAADPKFARAWIMLGEFLMGTRQTDAGTEAFQKAITAAPQEPAPHKIFAYSLMSTGKYQEAVPVWQEYIKLAPKDGEGPANLGTVFNQLKRYGEAAAILEAAAKLPPERANTQLQLAMAYLHEGDEEKATSAFKTYLGFDPAPEALNKAAYEMAETGKALGIALEYAQKATRAVEDESMKLVLASVHPGDETLVIKLAAYWTTLGMVQDRLGKAEEAEKSLNAAWKLTQDGVAAAHLCELYEHEHKTQAAIQMCRFAQNRLPMATLPSVSKVTDLVESNKANLERLSPGSSKSFHMPTVDAVIRMRNFKLHQTLPVTATGGFYLLFELDTASGQFKLQDTKYLSGSEKLKTVESSLRRVAFTFTSPDGNVTRMIRRGDLICGAGTECELLLLDPNSPQRITFHPKD